MRGRLPAFVQFYADQLAVVEGVVNEVKNETVVIVTLYSPFMFAEQTVGADVLARHIEDDPVAVAKGGAVQREGPVPYQILRLPQTNVRVRREPCICSMPWTNRPSSRDEAVHGFEPLDGGEEVTVNARKRAWARLLAGPTLVGRVLRSTRWCAPSADGG